MAAPVTTPTLSMQSFFSTTLSAGISSSDTVIPLNAVPTGTEGFLVIDQDNASKEIIYYNTKGGSSVTAPNVSTGRGQGGTTAVSHLSGATVKLNMVDQYWSELQNGNAFSWGTGAKLTGGPAWTSFTPTFTNLSVSNGTLVGKYQQIGKTVRARVSLVFGSTTAVSGDVSFTLPVTAAAYAGTGNVTPLGCAQFYDLSATRVYQAMVSMGTTTTAVIRAQAADLSFLYFFLLSSTVPFTWATGDEIGLSFEYEAA